ncbi:MAG TPA: hypothetical protein VN256_13260 [Pyrinomonadaceae bacterium]|nr:hypothetical protein [Pyrinomonadaceae bacterium]
MADYSSTITTGGSAQTAAAADANRATLLIQNSDDTDFWVRFGGTAAATSPSIFVGAGDTQFYGPEYRSLITQAISIFGATTGKKFTITDTKM